MRNIFDQYSQQENRVTHALMVALNEDRDFLSAFLIEFLGIKKPPARKELNILVQQLPGHPTLSEEEASERGIPDGWVYDEDGWCLFIESKVTAQFDAAQIDRHFKEANKRGFRKTVGVAIVVKCPAIRPDHIQIREWKEVYLWLRQLSTKSSWAEKVARYLEVVELQLVQAGTLNEGTLTMFTGIPFNSKSPFDYFEAKRLLKLARQELVSRADLRNELQVDSKSIGRGAITGTTGTSVWDFIALNDTGRDVGFTRHPHLTLGISSTHVSAMVTVPNNVNSFMRKRIKQLEQKGFEDLIRKVVENLGPIVSQSSGAAPMFVGVQRRYPSQRAVPYTDAGLNFDLRTVTGDGLPKHQPIWFQAAFDAFQNPRGANYQIQLGVFFPYEKCPIAATPEIIEHIAQSWIACKPLLDLDRPD
jgi:hypothetical protein